RIIISLTARYFTRLFDPYFLSNAYAFRASRKGKCVTHHDAVQMILSFRKKFRSNDIWVAECDIQKFFDCVNHNLILDALKSLSQKHSIDVDRRAYEIFLQYLHSYSFNKDVLPLN